MQGRATLRKAKHTDCFMDYNLNHIAGSAGSAEQFDPAMRYAGFIETASRVFSQGSVSLIQDALLKAHKALLGMKRYDGSPLLDHSVNTAQVVIGEIGLGRHSAIATLLHDAVRMELIQLDEVESLYGHDPVSIMKGMNLISTVDTKISSKQADNFRDLILSYSTDPRVILIKLADRLEVMRSLVMFPENKRQKKSWESMNLYAQIAHKLGLYSIKSELEDISLGYLEPADYNYIKTRLHESAVERDKFIAGFSEPIVDKLNRAGIKFTLKGRTKSIYSIWRKMKRTKVSFDEVFDIFAIRIVIDCPRESEKQLCWAVYSIVTDFYIPNPDRLRDWVSIPKSNGYESLHTTVVTKEGQWVEIQIRSGRMDEVAERGIAAHWRYKGVHSGASRNEVLLSQMRELLEETEKKRLSERIDMNDSLEEIFVFTPKGDLRKLPQGATVLDFAYNIHTSVGNTCTGARIGERNVPIKEKLHNGDIVNIITAKSQHPKPDWLNIAVTGKARGRIKAFLREEEGSSSDIGREILERKLKNWKQNIALDDAVTLLCKHYRIKNGKDLYIQIAKDKINPLDIKEVVGRHLNNEEPGHRTRSDFASSEIPEASGAGDALVIDDSIKNIEYKMGKCCSPIYGDDIFGFITISSGITVHRVDCPNARRLREQYPYRIIEARWRDSNKAGNSFVATIRLSAQDTTGIVNNITDLIASELKINIRSISISHDRNNTIGGVINIEVPNSRTVDMAVSRIARLKGVEKVYRVTV